MYRSVPARCMAGRWPCSSSHELVQREIAEARMRTYLVEVSPPFFDQNLRLPRDRNHSRLRHSSRNLPLKLAATPFCQGLPGSTNAVPMPCMTVNGPRNLLTLGRAIFPTWRVGDQPFS
jgi:hypothetical protein